MSEPRPLRGEFVLLGILLSTLVLVGAWIASGLPRSSVSQEFTPVIRDHAALLPEITRQDVARFLRLLHQDTGIEIEVHTHPEALAPGHPAWRRDLEQERLGELGDGIPRILVLVGGGTPLLLDLRWNQGLGEALDVDYLLRVEERWSQTARRRRRPDLAIFRLVRGISERLQGFLEQPVSPDSPPGFSFRPPIRRWPRRFHGIPEEVWNRSMLQALGGLLVAGVLVLLVSPTGRRLLGYGGRPPLVPGTRGRGPFLGGAASGGFGGAAWGGGRPPPSW